MLIANSKKYFHQKRQEVSSSAALTKMKPWPLNGAIYGEKCVIIVRSVTHACVYFLLRRSKRILISILACSLAFHAITFKRSSYTKIAILKMNLLVSLFRCLVARCCRKRGNRQTDRQKSLRTKYSNPRCACAPRVKNGEYRDG